MTTTSRTPNTYKTSQRRGPAQPMSRAAALAVRAALALADAYTSGDTVELDTAAAFCSGELSSWRLWNDDRLDDRVQRQLGVLLRRRPRQLADPAGFRRAALALHNDGQLPEFDIDTGLGQARARHGRPAGELAADLIDQLAATSLPTGSGRARLTAGEAQVWAGDRRYSLTVPSLPVSEPVVPAEIRDAVPQPELSVPAAELVGLAQRLVDAGRAEHLLRVGALLTRLQDPCGELVPQLTIAAGPTQLLQAPTASGKSVMLRLLAVHAALTGRTVTLALPDTTAVLHMARDIEGDLAALGSDAHVAALTSPDSTMRRLAAQLADPDADAALTDWLLRRWSYACALAGAVDGPQVWPVGQEPCRECPLQDRCAKFAEQRRAVHAAVIVTNHDSFIASRLRLPVQPGCGDGQAPPPASRMPVSELVLRRSDLVCIDEADLFQHAVATHASSDLALTNGRSLTPALRRFRTQADDAIGGDLPEPVARQFPSAWSNFDHLVNRYVTACATGELGPFDPRGRPLRHLVLPGRHDPVLALRLAGKPDSADVDAADLDLLRAVSDPESGPAAADLTDARAMLREAVSAAGGEDRLPVAQAGLLAALAGRIPDQTRRANTVDLLLHRAFLRALQHAIQQLAGLLGELRQAGVTASDQIQEGLGRLAAWQLAPWGLLGQLRMAFRLPGADDGTVDDLKVRAVAGDPHEYVAELGRALSLTLAGTRRPVLAVSATGHLPGAAMTHLHRPVSWLVPDPPDAPVTLTLRHVVGQTGTPIKISGTPRATREADTVALGAGLWLQHLDRHLTQLAATPEHSPRARALVVANSYAQLADLATGLVSAGCPATQIAVAVPDRTGPDRPGPVAGTVTVPISRLATVTRDHPEARIVLAPLARVSRGLNLVNPDGRSAIASIWLAVRPVPLVDEPDQLLAHAGAHARQSIPAGDDFGATLRRRRQRADQHLRAILNSPPQFSRLPDGVRLDLAAGVLVDLIQLLGRARRGQTPAELNLVDGAFAGADDGHAGWPRLIGGLHRRWQRDADLALLRSLYGGTLTALFALADPPVTPDVVLPERR